MTKLLFFFMLLSFISCSNQESNNTKEISNIPQLPGKAIYSKNCKLCHGSNGELGLSGAANLAISALTIEEKILVITNGRKAMASYKNQLSIEEIKMVAAYIETLKK